MVTEESLPPTFEAGGWTYRPIRRLGRGGMASVFLAERARPGMPPILVALKVLHDGGADAPTVPERFADEARLLLLLNHEHIVRLLDAVEIHGRPGLVLEFVDGVTMGSLLGGGAVLPDRVVAEAGRCVASALAWAERFVPHGGAEPVALRHRDLKPDNVMFTRTGGVRVLDFGIARAADAYRRRVTTDARALFGTPGYIPPEAFAGEDHAAWDVFALGGTLAAALLGEEPAMGSPAWKLARRLEGRPLAPLLLAMTARDPTDRPTASEVESSLGRAAGVVAGPSLADWARQGFPVARSAEPPPKMEGVFLSDTIPPASRPSSLPDPSPISCPATDPFAETPTRPVPRWAVLAGGAGVGLAGLAALVGVALTVLALRAPEDTPVDAPPEATAVQEDPGPAAAGEGAAAPGPPPVEAPAEAEVVVVEVPPARPGRTGRPAPTLADRAERPDEPSPRAETATKAEVAPARLAVPEAEGTVALGPGCERVGVTLDGAPLSATRAVTAGRHAVTCDFSEATGDAVAPRSASCDVGAGQALGVTCTVAKTRCACAPL